MKKIRIGVNIDHVATVRNARGEKYPDPLRAALLSQKSGSDSVTIHLREDRRHITEIDLKNITKKLKIPLNLEVAPTNEMFKMAKKYKPRSVCIVPEKRREITTEGGLNLNIKRNSLKRMIENLKKEKIRVSLFIEPTLSNVILSKKLRADCVELHTGKICRMINKNNKTKNLLKKINRVAQKAKKIGLDVHAGHGMTFKSAMILSRIKYISEFNIGHFIIGESIFIGLDKVIKKFKKILKR